MNLELEQRLMRERWALKTRRGRPRKIKTARHARAAHRRDHAVEGGAWVLGSITNTLRLDGIASWLKSKFPITRTTTAGKWRVGSRYTSCDGGRTGYPSRLRTCLRYPSPTVERELNFPIVRHGKPPFDLN